MTDAPLERDWTATDEQSNGDRFIEYLETASSFAAIRAYKARSIRDLGLEDGDAVIDAGCGIGDDVRALSAAVGPTGEVLGIDASERLITRARERTSEFTNARVAVGDIYDLDVARDSFDASRADRVLQHLERPPQAIEELVRVTRPGGRIGLTDPDWGAMVIDAPGREATHQFLDPDYAVPRHATIGRRLYRLARRFDLEDISVDSFMVNTTDFEFTYEMAELEGWTETMRENGVIVADELEAWRERLTDAHEAGTFFAALPAHTVTGTVPE